METTIAELETRTSVLVDPHLERSAMIPVLSGVPQRQGDVLLIPTRERTGMNEIDGRGVPVIRGENGGNTHALHAYSKMVYYTTIQDGSLILGVLTVDHGGVAILSHPQHGFLGIGPGSYEVRRQREQAEQIRIVAD